MKAKLTNVTAFSLFKNLTLHLAWSTACESVNTF
jgi:hypothetical protein